MQIINQYFLKKSHLKLSLQEALFANLYFLCEIYSPEAYSEPGQTSKMECFMKIVNYFRKTLHLRYLTGF